MAVRVLMLSVCLLVGGWASGEAGQGPGGGHGCGGGGGCQGGAGCGGGGTDMASVRDVFHGLLSDHDSIDRVVRNVEGGVATTTTSDDPELAERIRLHVRQMEDRLRAGDGLRHWDPLYVEIFRHHDAIEMQLEDLPDGIRVTETSEDPQVVELIRQHAQTVSEFVERGFDRAHEASPLPEGYQVETAGGRGRGAGPGHGGGCGKGCCGRRAAATK